MSFPDELPVELKVRRDAGRTYLVRTLGCKANLHDSQLLEAELQKRGWRPADRTGEARLCIVNSCTVTDEADRQSRKLASRLSRENPEARVVVTGCAAEVDPERLAASRGIHYVVGNQDKPRLVDLIVERLERLERAERLEEKGPRVEVGEVLGSVTGYEEMLSRHPMDRDWQEPERVFRAPPILLEGQTRKTRAFLKIQEGCNSFCTYCVIPYGRGPSRSLRPGEIAEQVRGLVREGVREAILTGTNIGDYGVDWGEGPALVDLLKTLLSTTAIERIRVSSLDPSEILMPGLLELMASEPRICPHFHVSLQSIDSHILRMMKRRYSFVEVEKCLIRISELRREEPVYVGMDVITGFPGETDEIFERSFERLRSLPWMRLHVFPYSERAGTPATRLPGSVPQHMRVARARRLQALSLERARVHAEEALRRAQASRIPLSGVLLEAATQEGVYGYTPGYLRVLVQDPQAPRNRLGEAWPEAVHLDPASGEAWVSAKLLKTW